MLFPSDMWELIRIESVLLDKFKKSCILSICSSCEFIDNSEYMILFFEKLFIIFFGKFLLDIELI